MKAPFPRLRLRRGPSRFLGPRPAFSGLNAIRLPAFRPLDAVLARATTASRGRNAGVPGADARRPPLGRSTSQRGPSGHRGSRAGRPPDRV
ncbi:hypothetical protein DMC61_23715 [Amycolatopsis sp. WAC 04169]|nr:hypothetical protein DMC61_23715 [Amycolatopsis sp. WAC 04169]